MTPTEEADADADGDYRRCADRRVRAALEQVRPVFVGPNGSRQRLERKALSIFGPELRLLAYQVYNGLAIRRNVPWQHNPDGEMPDWEQIEAAYPPGRAKEIEDDFLKSAWHRKDIALDAHLAPSDLGRVRDAAAPEVYVPDRDSAAPDTDIPRAIVDASDDDTDADDAGGDDVDGERVLEKELSEKLSDLERMLEEVREGREDADECSRLLEWVQETLYEETFSRHSSGDLLESARHLASGILSMQEARRVNRREGDRHAEMDVDTPGAFAFLNLRPECDEKCRHAPFTRAAPLSTVPDPAPPPKSWGGRIRAAFSFFGGGRRDATPMDVDPADVPAPPAPPPADSSADDDIDPNEGVGDDPTSHVVVLPGGDAHSGVWDIIRRLRESVDALTKSDGAAALDDRVVDGGDGDGDADDDEDAAKDAPRAAPIQMRRGAEPINDYLEGARTGTARASRRLHVAPTPRRRR